MASRNYITHTVTSTVPPAPSAGDEFYDPTTNLLTKTLVVNGTALQQVVIATAGGPVVANTVTATGNITGGNIIGTLVANSFSTAGNIQGGNLLTSGILSVTGNVDAGNLRTAGLISATGTVTGSSHLGAVVSVTANVTGGNVLTAGLVSATGNITTANTVVALGAANTGVLAAVIGNVSNVNLHAQSVAVMGGNANGSVQFAFQNYSNLANASTDLAIYNNAGTDATYFIDMGIVGNTYNGAAVGANIFGANDGYLYVAGNSITGPVGTGANVGNLILGATNGQVITWLGNTSTANIITVVGSAGLSVTGIMSASGNVTGGNLRTVGLISATGNITGGNILGGANVNATTHTGTTVSVTGNVTGGNIITAGLASVTGNVNIGNATGVTWANTAGPRVWTYYNNAAVSLDTVFL